MDTKQLVDNAWQSGGYFAWIQAVSFFIVWVFYREVKPKASSQAESSMYETALFLLWILHLTCQVVSVIDQVHDDDSQIVGKYHRIIGTNYSGII